MIIVHIILKEDSLSRHTVLLLKVSCPYYYVHT
jgi:hypothetical protein